MLRRYRNCLFLGLLLLFLLISIVITIQTVPPIQWELAEGVITTTQGMKLFPDDCFEVAWQFETGRTIRLNDTEVSKAGQQNVCGLSATLDIITIEQHLTQNIRLPAFSADPQHWWLFWVLLASALGIIVSVTGLPTFAGWRRDFRQWGQTLKVWLGTFARWEWALLAILTLLGAYIRWRYIGAWLTSDEGITIPKALSPLGVLLSDYEIPNNHILNTLLIHISTGLFGNTVTAVRLPTMLAGVLLIPVFYGTARRLYDARVAALITAFVGLHPVMVYYSVIARGYMLQTLFMGVLIVLGIHLYRKISYVTALGWIVFTALAFWTLPTSLYFYVALFIWVMGSIWFTSSGQQRRQLTTQFIVVNILAVLVVMSLYSPVLARYGWRSVLSNQYVSAIGWDYLRANWEATFAGYLFYWSLPLPLIAFAGMILFGWWGHRHWTRRGLPVPLIILLTFVVFIIVQRVFPPDRATTFLIPILWLLPVLGIVRLLNKLWDKRPWVYAPASLLLAGLFLTFFQPLTADPIQEATVDLTTLAGEGDVVATNISALEIISGYFHLYQHPDIALLSHEVMLRDSLAELDEIYFIAADWRIEASFADTLEKLFGVDAASLPEPDLIAEYPHDAAQPTLWLYRLRASDIQAALNR